MGARGNSGVILSQILRGLADTFSPLDAVSGADVVAGLRRAADAAYEAVLRPVEGTILTVVRSAAGVGRAGGRPRARPRSSACSSAPRPRRGDAVASTPDLLPVLREAGVVDAGGRGFELLLAACLHVVADRPLPARRGGALARSRSVRTPRRRGLARAARAVIADLRYEVMYFLDAPDDAHPRASRPRGAASATRSSSSAATASGTATCTPTTSAPPSRRASRSGRPRDIRVTDLLEQVADREEEAWVRDGSGADAAEPALEHVATGVVAVAVGDGLAHAPAQPRRAAGGRRWAVDEPVDRADPRSGRRVRRPTA